MQHRNVRGKIRYTSAKAGREGVERGREWFNFTHHADGSVIMTAQCEIEDPDPTVLRTSPVISGRTANRATCWST